MTQVFSLKSNLELRLQCNAVSTFLVLLVKIPQVAIEIEPNCQLLPKGRCLVGGMKCESCFKVQEVAAENCGNQVGPAVEFVVVILIALIEEGTIFFI